jgi:hypothetical protein
LSLRIEIAETNVSVHSSHHTPPASHSGGFLFEPTNPEKQSKHEKASAALTANEDERFLKLYTLLVEIERVFAMVESESIP